MDETDHTSEPETRSQALSEAPEAREGSSESRRVLRRLDELGARAAREGRTPAELFAEVAREHRSVVDERAPLPPGPLRASLPGRLADARRGEGPQ